MKIARRTISFIAAAGAVISLTACGSTEPDVSTGAPATVPTEATTVPATTPATTGEPATTVPLTPPDATISPDVPDAYLPGIGPLEVQGEALPSLPEGSIDADPALGMAAPILIGTDFDGNTVRVDAASDGPTMVVFVAHWCPHCNDEIPKINKLRDAGALPADLNIIAVSTGVDPARPNFPPGEWLVAKDWTYPVIADGVDPETGFLGAIAFGLSGFPFTTLIDGEGKVVARWSGERGDEIPELVSHYLGMG